MKWKSNRSIHAISYLIFFAVIYLIGFQFSRTDFTGLITSFLVGFAILIYWLKSNLFEDEKLIWLGAILPRVMLLFAIPALSDDYFRFIWDGQLMNVGINPFSSTPAEIGEIFRDTTIFEGLNSKGYYTVYPPVMQFCFGFTSFIAGDDVRLNIIFLKIIVLLGDVGVIYFAIKILKHFGMQIKNTIIYALNPMVIVETVGNLHFEGLMMFFTLWALYLLITMDITKWPLMLFVSAFIFSLGVSTKLISLLFLPALIRIIGLKKSFMYFLMIGVFSGLFFIFFIDQYIIDNFSSSLDLYFRNFEFNASLYFLANWIYEKIVGWQEIKYVGPIMAGISVGIIIFLSVRNKIINWEVYFAVVLSVLSVHLFFSTTVHPWYIINLLVASIFTKYRFAVIWSFVILLSYYFYKKMDLPSWMVVLEYSIVFGYLVVEFIYWKSSGKKELTSKLNLTRNNL